MEEDPNLIGTSIGQSWNVEHEPYYKEEEIWYCLNCEDYSEEHLEWVKTSYKNRDPDMPKELAKFVYDITEKTSIEPSTDTNYRKLSGSATYLCFKKYEEAIKHSKNCWNRNHRVGPFHPDNYSLKRGVDIEKFHDEKLPEIARKHEKNLNYDRAISIYTHCAERKERHWNDWGNIEKKSIKRIFGSKENYQRKMLEWKTDMEKFYADLERVRKLKAEMSAPKTEIHGDYVDDRDTIVRDSVINRSNVGGSSKMQELKDLTEMKEKGLIDDDEFKQMKKEILGK